MKFKRPTFNQMVLRRRQQQSNRRWLIGKTICVVLLAISYTAVNIYFSRHRSQPLHEYLAFTGPVQTRESIIRFTPEGIPTILSINGELWDVARVHHFADAEKHKPGEAFSGVQAQTFCAQHLIAYIETESPSRLRANVWHEVMHAAAPRNGLGRGVPFGRRRTPRRISASIWATFSATPSGHGTLKRTS